MVIVICIVVVLLGFPLIKALYRRSRAEAMNARQTASAYVSAAMEEDRTVTPTWFPHDKATLVGLVRQIEDGLKAGGVDAGKAKAMSEIPNLQLLGLTLAAGYEVAGMGKISQLAAAGTDFQGKAKSIERKLDGLGTATQ